MGERGAGSVSPRPLVTPAAADRIAGEHLVPMGTGLAVLFYVFSVANVLLLEPPARWPMAALAFLSASVLLLAVRWVKRNPTEGLAHAIGTFGFSIGLINASARLWLTGDPAYSSNFALVTVGVGLVFLDLRWGIAVIGATVATWWALALRIPHATASFGYTVGGGALLSITILIIRARIYGHLEALRVEAEDKAKALSDSENRYRLALSGSNDGLYEWEPLTDEITFSEQVRGLLGADAADQTRTLSSMAHMIHEDDVDRVKQRLVAHLRGEDDLFEDEFRIQESDGSHTWVLVRGASHRDADGQVLRMAGSITDMSRRGVFDPLTGLPNRRLFLDRLDRVTSQRAEERKSEESFAVLFIDLDGFKLINDTLGHHAGDELLREVSARLLSCVRASDTVARLGGDEFVVLLTKVDSLDGVEIAVNRITRRLGTSYDLGDRNLHVMPSIGVVIDSDRYACSEELLRDADLAMYRAKESNEVVVFFDSDMRNKVQSRLNLELELREALDHGQFRLHFQSIVSLVDGSVEGYEALCRWEHPTRGVLLPSHFIGVMEETGLIVELGRWVIASGCRSMMERFSDGSTTEMPFLSVNLSGKHLTRDDLVPTVEAALEETGFPASKLRIELTESAIIDNPKKAASQLGQLRLLGVRILMDDFGTGHSSLSYLQTLPIDTLKIDRSFIRSMTQHPDGAELVRTIIRMTSNLGLSVVAEGIETEEQVSMLQAMDCASGQGFLFARPSPLAELTPEAVAVSGESEGWSPPSE